MGIDQNGNDELGKGLNMAKVLVVTSGKGGVGKTTSTAALGAALAQAGENVVVVDFDVGLRNLDLVMGAERRVVYDMINVIQGDAKLAQALIRDKRIDNLSLLPASQTRDKDALTDAGVASIIEQLREKFDWIICDSPAGHREGRDDGDALCRCRGRRHQPRSVLGARFRSHHRHARFEDPEGGADERIEKHLLLTRYDAGRAARGEMLKTEDVLEILSIPLLGHRAGERGCAERVEPRLAGDVEQSVERGGEGVFRRGATAARRAVRGRRADREERPDGSVVRTEGGMNIGGMNLRTLFRRQRTAPVARERLQVLLAHERVAAGHSELLAVLREEILAVIAKHITVDRDKVNVKLDRGADSSTLEIDVEMPAVSAEGASARRGRGGRLTFSRVPRRG